MLRLQTLFLITCLLIVVSQPVSGQYEKEAGKLLFENIMYPVPAGPGKVAYLRADPKNYEGPIELYLGDANTHTEKRVLPGVDFSKMPVPVFSWSLDGSEFVIPQLSDGSWEIFRYKSGSRTGEKISNLLKYRETTLKELLTQQGLTEDMLLTVGQLAYSPSGKRILFRMCRPGKSSLWWIDPLTGNTRQATEDKIGYYGSFGPDDDHICYTISRLNPGGGSATEDIVLRSLKTAETDTLTNSPAMEFSGVISPDGKYLAYVITTTSVNNIWVMNLATKQSRQFTFATAGKNCTTPNWTPDGKQIVFFGVGFAAQPSVFVKDFLPF
jgi:Tol biopolymer transport system component